MSTERDLTVWLGNNVPRSGHVKLGIGDDAAVLDWSPGGDLVVTTDTVTDGVDFILQQVNPQWAGHKALAVNLSDLAAMAAEPVAAVVSLVLPRRGSGTLDALELAKRLYGGILPLAERFGLAIAGGDTNSWDGPLAISITALGRTTTHGPLRRSGAQPGDWVLVTGSLGGSILGKHLHVEPRVREALLLHSRYALHAGIDISDGLALDASRVAAASGCGVAIETSAIPIADNARRFAESTGRTPVAHALGDGEDFELLLAVEPESAQKILDEQPLDVPVTAIGRCVEQAGLWQIGAGGLSPLEKTGYQH